MTVETSRDVVERIVRSVSSGAMTLPAALTEAFWSGNRAGWTEAQLMRAAEIRPTRRRATTTKKRGER